MSAISDIEARIRARAQRMREGVGQTLTASARAQAGGLVTFAGATRAKVSGLAAADESAEAIGILVRIRQRHLSAMSQEPAA